MNLTLPDMLTVAVPVIILALIAWPLGVYMARVFDGRPPRWIAWMRPVEASIYRLAAIDPSRSMPWTTYAAALLVFNAFGFIAVYLLQRMQARLPLNSTDMPNVGAESSFNTSISFVTNTNWQGYAGEVTMSHLTQMLALTTQNFVSAATGIAVLLAVARGFARSGTSELGNFWVDLVRSVLFVLLPLSVIVALGLVAGGVPQTLAGRIDITGVQGVEQLLAIGPMASQVAIKQLGTNGGGFLNANSAHPFENPNAITNLIELVSILAVPVALPVTFGKLIGRAREGVALCATMGILLLIGLVIATGAERSGNPALTIQGISPETTIADAEVPAGNMEGKELRFGIAQSTTWTVFTSAASNGSVNSMLDSYTPLGGLVPMANIATSEVIFGGVGSGVYGMLLYAIIAIFVAGVMVGRSPEYLGKKIDAYDIRMALIGLLIVPALILGLTAVALVTDSGLERQLNAGPHGLSEVFYAFTSAAGNNGSAFAGLSANVPFYNILLGVAMALGRYLIIVPVLAMAGSLARKHVVPTTEGTLPTSGMLWIALLAGVVVIFGALTFMPILALGPVVEHIFLDNGVSFPAP
jgi:K+-transporting ATPase ATPase A chain